MNYVAVAVQHAPLHVHVDPLSGEAEVGAHAWGMTRADEAALETALRIAERWGTGVLAVTAGSDAAEATMRTAIAAGAAAAVLVRIDDNTTTGELAAALAAAVSGCMLVICGDAGPDHGSGAVPGWLAAELDAAQALGCLEVEACDAAGTVRVTRRLDHGHRERLALRAPAVVSVEAGAARLRRATLAAVLAAATAPISMVAAGERAAAAVTEHALPYRPRAHAVSGPRHGLRAFDRVALLTSALPSQRSRDVVEASPAAAAVVLLDRLRAWGYRT